MGFFDGQKVERLGGLLYMVMSPQKTPHAYAVDEVHTLLRDLFGPAFWARMQLPLELRQSSDPEPDVSVVVGPKSAYRVHHPSSAVLVVEVSDTALGTDRGWKASLYAAAGVQEYWVLDVNGRRLDVCRDPQPNADEPCGWCYADRRWLTSADTIAPLAAPLVSVSVAALLG